MRIGCLQFAPRTGDVDFNLSRADSVLSKADQTALDGIDVIVCPELAFSGSNFHSLQDISPYLEPSTSGITALWARTTALRYNATVAIGYPEKVETWPAAPEYYNSLVVVNGEGETVANIRKRGLTASDKKWALESRQDGFVSVSIEGVGQTTLGISTDLFSPSPDFEFALHAVEAAANLILVTMSWVARSEARTFSRTPLEPDMDALACWTQQLVPLIEADGRDEVVVVFCNRCGSEGQVAYSGTSAVLGVKDGAVSVYGLLGRGVKELLVVDTNNPPFARLVQAESDQPSRSQDLSSVLHQSFNKSQLSPGLPSDGTRPYPASAFGTSIKPRATTPPRPARHRPREGSPSPVMTRASRAKSRIPKLQLPGHASPDTYASAPDEGVNRRCYMSGEGTSPNVETPTCPSPIPDTLRPQVAAGAAVSEHLLGHGSNSMPLSPTTPFLDFFRNTSPLSPVSPFRFSTSPSSPVSPFRFSTSPLHSPQAPRSHDGQLFWVPPRKLLKSPTSTTTSALGTPMDRVMSMFSVSAPTSLAATSKAQVRETKPAPARPTPSTRPDAKETRAAESPSRPCTWNTCCGEAAQPRMISATPPASPETAPKTQWTETCTQSADITTSPTASHSAVPSMATVVSHSPSVAPPLDCKPLSTADIEAHPDTRPGMSRSTRRSHSNDSFCARSGPPFTGPSSQRVHLGHARSRSLSGSEKRGRQGNNHDSLQRTTLTSGDSIADQTSLLTQQGQWAAPVVPSPDSDFGFRGRMPDIPRPCSIPRQRQPASSSFGPEIPRHSSIPRQRRSTSSRDDACSRTRKTQHRLGSDPNDDIVATISKITPDCPHHAVNRPTGPIVQSPDGSLYTIELPQHVQDLAVSLLTRSPTDTRLESRQSLVRKSSVW